MYWAIPDIDLEKCVFRKQPKEKFVLILNMNQKDPDYLLFSKCRLFFKKSIKMLLWIWLVLKCQDTIYPKRLPSRGAKSWMWGGFAWPKRWSSKFSIDAVIFSRMLPHDLLMSVNSFFFFLGKYDIFCMVGPGLDGIRFSSGVSKDYIKPRASESVATSMLLFWQQPVSLFPRMAWPNTMWHVLEEVMWQSGSSRRCCTRKIWHLIWNQSWF